jgi:cob(I)alamin adenosyltransferase
VQQNKPFINTDMFKSYFKVGSWTGLSRVFGLLRDITTTTDIKATLLEIQKQLMTIAAELSIESKKKIPKTNIA